MPATLTEAVRHRDRWRPAGALAGHSRTTLIGVPAADADQPESLIAQGERAAFHGRPLDGLKPLGQALASGVDADQGARARWLLGVCLAAMGRYGQAIVQLHPVLADISTPTRGNFAGLAAATMASVQRQLNRYAEARQYDQWAVSAVPGNLVVLTDAWMGLAADAVGTGDVSQAEQCLARATRYYSGREEWRTSLRIEWVRTEISLVRGDPATAIEYAQDALARAETADAPRHVAKSLLFLGSSQLTVASRGPAVDTVTLASAVSTLRRGAALAQSLGALPLVWPAHMLLSQALPPEDQARLTHRAAAAAALREILKDLPPSIATGWAAQPEVAALLR